jgi:hypothetical protein
MAETKKCNVNELKVGDVLSRVSYMKIVGVKGGSFRVKNESGYE